MITRKEISATAVLGRLFPPVPLGITVKVEEAYDIHAKKLGKTADELTDVERKQAFANAALEKGRIAVEKKRVPDANKT